MREELWKTRVGWLYRKGTKDGPNGRELRERRELQEVRGGRGCERY